MYDIIRNVGDLRSLYIGTFRTCFPQCITINFYKRLCRDYIFDRSLCYCPRSHRKLSELGLHWHFNTRNIHESTSNCSTVKEVLTHELLAIS